MDVVLGSKAEEKARAAESLPAFGGLNLLHVKRQVALLLSLIGRNRIFDEYTRHDITHIDSMLRMLDWIVPDSTQKVMSPADWLLAVLGIYFHDLGMLVTKKEYDQRARSGFPEFCNQVLFADTEGQDYKTRVEKLPPDELERFLYQEFVRHTHAERIRRWILGTASEHLGISHKAVAEVDRLLEPLGQQFRRDLGVVCESHHLDDLADLKKYDPSQPYGNSDEETANVQYAAVLLRTADLLHITSDRTPSIAFRVINPEDPLSQEEWAKQMAVKRVRPKLGVDKEGVPDEKAPKDTIEVHAYFTSEDGFFGLTSYLAYAEKQLAKSRTWISMTNRINKAPHEFPWAWIDDSNIETEGFIRDAYEFTIDQKRILDLLTGHTLYNDSRVVLRELVQNSLDAIRFQQEIEKDSPTGAIDITWDSKERVLCVQDNGTGMTQGIVTEYLLKVGSSRYQDPEFKKQYPNFSPISRFGIGVLTAFMIADTVEITTCHPDEESGRRLSLRSVHGKYLIRLLDKQDDPVAKTLGPHGTLFRLRVRPSAEVPDVLLTARQWVVMPGCDVSVTIDDGASVRVGYASPKEALERQLEDAGYRITRKDEPESPFDASIPVAKVVERTKEGTSLACAVKWSSFFRDWAFLNVSELSKKDAISLGTCVEGVRVEFSTPGYEGKSVVAIANVRGLGAPRTNVARYGLESTTERDEMLRQVYAMYFEHISDEIGKLHTNRAFSMTWAADEGHYLLQPLLVESTYRMRGEVNKPLSREDFEEALRDLPILLVEEEGDRRMMTVRDLRGKNLFWTVDCNLFQSAETLLREIQSNASLSSLIGVLSRDSIFLPKDTVLCPGRRSREVDKLIFAGKEVDLMQIDKKQRRVDMRWVNCAASPRWRSMPEAVLKIYRSEQKEYYGYRPTALGPILVGVGSVDVEPAIEEIAVRAMECFFLLPGSPIAQYINALYDKVSTAGTREVNIVCHCVLKLVEHLFVRGEEITEPEKIVNRGLARIQRDMGFDQPVGDIIDLGKLYDSVGKTKWGVFDVKAWIRELVLL